MGRLNWRRECQVHPHLSEEHSGVAPARRTHPLDNIRCVPCSRTSVRRARIRCLRSCVDRCGPEAYRQRLLKRSCGILSLRLLECGFRIAKLCGLHSVFFHRLGGSNRVWPQWKLSRIDSPPNGLPRSLSNGTLGLASSILMDGPMAAQGAILLMLDSRRSISTSKSLTHPGTGCV
jgi:hypothetical protein